MCVQNLSGVVMAVTEISKANLKNDHSITTNLQYKNADGTWHDIICNYICYTTDGTKYPAYCIKHGVHGVDEEGAYTVNISKLLSDNRIWRVIVNGYPYKTPAQIGVETADDAYLATKQAINSVVLDRDVKSYYNGTNEKGKKVVNAIYHLANIGRNGTQTMQDANLVVSKSKGITKYNDSYYYTEYKVSADVAISNYRVTSITDFPSGSYVTDTSGNKTQTFHNGENFRVMIPRNNINADFTGKVQIEGKCKTYPIFFGEAPKSTVQDYAITYDAYGDFKASGKFSEKVNTAKIKVIKKDAESSEVIEGVSYRLSHKDGTEIDTKKTNEKGEIEFKGLYPGEYILQEIATNEQYILDTSKHGISLEYDATITKTFTNKHKKGNLKIIKIDKDNHNMTLGGIEFDLYNENKEKIAHLTTDADGEAIIENINTGRYTLKETKTKREYKLCVDEDLVVKWNETANIVIQNEKKKGQIKVIKEDKDHHQVKLAGVEFAVLDSQHRMIEKVVTDQNGEATTSRLPIGEYQLKEISLGSNTTYVMNEEIHTIKVEEDKIKEIHFENEHQKGKLKIVKVDKDDHQIPLAGVAFEITDEMGTQYHVETDKKGIIEIDNIRTGKVTVKETKTNDLYWLDQEEHKVEVRFHQTSELQVENEKKKGQVEVYKVDTEDKKIKLPGVEFAIFDNHQNKIDTLITDKNGHAISKHIPVGSYYLKEVKTNQKYILNDEPISIEIREKDITTMQFENQKKKGRISILKISSKDSPILPIKQGEALSNVSFEIYDMRNNLIETVKTNEQGEAISKWLEVGRYKIKEVSTLKYYLLNEKEYFTTITENGEMKKVTIENEPEIPGLEIKKTGPEYAKKNEEIEYQFHLKNSGNTELNDFTWTEYLPFEQIKITKMVTGTYTHSLPYKIYYKTNKKEYRFLREADTKKSEYIDFLSISLEKNEKIQEIKMVFGTVPVGFKSITKPILIAKIEAEIKKDEVIKNKTELHGTSQGIQLEDKDTCETKINETEIKKKLPRTGC